MTLPVTINIIIACRLILGIDIKEVLFYFYVTGGLCIVIMISYVNLIAVS